MNTKEELNTQIKRFQITAETFHKKGDRSWAYAKNGMGEYHYTVAREAYARVSAKGGRMSTDAASSAAAGFELGVVEASIAVDDFVENTTGPIRDGVCDVLECVSKALDSFSIFLDWL